MVKQTHCLQRGIKNPYFSDENTEIKLVEWSKFVLVRKKKLINRKIIIRRNGKNKIKIKTTKVINRDR